MCGERCAAKQDVNASKENQHFGFRAHHGAATNNAREQAGQAVEKVDEEDLLRLLEALPKIRQFFLDLQVFPKGRQLSLALLVLPKECQLFLGFLSLTPRQRLSSMGGGLRFSVLILRRRNAAT